MYAYFYMCTDRVMSCEQLTRDQSITVPFQQEFVVQSIPEPEFYSIERK